MCGFIALLKMPACTSLQAQNSTDNSAFDNVYTYVPLDLPDARTIRKLMEFNGV